MKIELLTRKDILIGLHNEILDRLVRAEIDLTFWTGIGVDPRKNFDAESTKNVRRKVQDNKMLVENSQKLLEIIEKKLKEGDK